MAEDPSQKLQRRIKLATALLGGAFAAAGVAGIAAGVKEQRDWARLRSGISGRVGTHPAFQGDWWDARGRGLYHRAVAEGTHGADAITAWIFHHELGDDPVAQQFPPNETTVPPNEVAWNTVRERVVIEQAAQAPALGT